MKGSVTACGTILCVDAASGGSLALILLKGFLSIIEVILFDRGGGLRLKPKSSFSVIKWHNVAPDWEEIISKGKKRRDWRQKVLPVLLFLSSSSTFCLFLDLSFRRWGVAMPFGCLTIGEKKDYNNPSDVTDKYDLGQIVKSWVSRWLHPQHLPTDFWMLLSFLATPLWSGFISLWILSGRSSARYSGPRIKPRWKCTRVKSSWRRMGGKSARLRKTRSSSWRCELSVAANVCLG